MAVTAPSGKCKQCSLVLVHSAIVTECTLHSQTLVSVTKYLVLHLYHHLVFQLMASWPQQQGHASTVNCPHLQIAARTLKRPPGLGCPLCTPSTNTEFIEEICLHPQGPPPHPQGRLLTCQMYIVF